MLLEVRESEMQRLSLITRNLVLDPTDRHSPDSHPQDSQLFTAASDSPASDYSSGD